MHHSNCIADLTFTGAALNAPNDWDETRRHLQPAEEGDWTPISSVDGRPSIDATKLAMPILENGHYTCLIRFRSKLKENFWDYAILDSLNSAQQRNKIAYRFALHTTILHDPDDMSEQPGDNKENARRWLLNCKRQNNTECGHRTLLHMHLAMTCESMVEFRAKLGRLETIHNLHQKSREWVEQLLDDSSANPAALDWLADLTR